jgi:hypothetical protein
MTVFGGKSAEAPPDVTWTIDGRPNLAKGQRIIHFPDGQTFRHDLTVTHRGVSKRMVLYSFAAKPTGFYASVLLTPRRHGYARVRRRRRPRGRLRRR